mmetsp:Transcript_693/g.869  ORF Transcript_693/g.869 Transcript_693/m.869 type:complete len:186 (-) Transcript_693:53-610(-)
MGVDIANKHKKLRKKTQTHSEDPYLRLLIKLYRFLARRTDSNFNKLILKRLCQSRTVRAPLSLHKAIRFSRGHEDQIVVLVGTVTDDPRILKTPKLSICALKFTEGARNRILNAGGECLTFDQLALRAPTGSNTLLLRGPRKARKSFKYFGVPGNRNSHTRPRTRGKGRKIEKARGRRKSKGYKV